MERGRLREFGIAVGTLETGARNAITDVPGVRVGHVTLSAAAGYDASVCTGVTAILANDGDLFQQKLPAASHVINGFGKTAGLVQLDELGQMEAPILLTNTFSVGAVLEGGLRYMLARDESLGDRQPSPNVVVGECNDGYLNDMRGLHVRPSHAVQAIENADSGSVAEGAVGAGTGMRCCGWKGGIGSSSRRIPGSPHQIGVLVLSNFGAPEDLVVLGVPVGRRLRPGDALAAPADGSILMVVATDLPWDALQLRRLARRTVFGLARIGAVAAHGSGDIAIAFSTVRPDAGDIPDEIVSRCFRAVADATEKAILNSLTTAETTAGRSGRVVPGIPLERLAEIVSGLPARG